MTKQDIPERDKPFYLALVSAGITIGSMFIIALGAWTYRPEMIESGKEVLFYTFPLTSMAWAMYFKSKK